MPFDVYKSFLPECFLDTNLVEVLLNRPVSVNHQKGNSKIAVLMANRLANNFVVALIDDDKRKLQALEEFRKVSRLCRLRLRLYNHPARKHFFIQVSPAIEKWILAECDKGGINLSDYNLPSDLKGLKDLKSGTQRNDVRFSQLFRDMLQNERCDEIIELHRWLTFFRDNHYNSNIEAL